MGIWQCVDSSKSINSKGGSCVHLVFVQIVKHLRVYVCLKKANLLKVWVVKRAHEKGDLYVNNFNIIENNSNSSSGTSDRNNIENNVTRLLYITSNFIANTSLITSHTLHEIQKQRQHYDGPLYWDDKIRCCMQASFQKTYQSVCDRSCR